MYMSFRKDKDGIWKVKKPLRGVHSSYSQAIEKYLNCLEPLFAKAQKKDEFHFILTLIRVKQLEDAGWDPFETIQDVFEGYSKIKGKIKHDGDSLAHYSLFLYGLIIEASELYEILANLLNIIEGKAYSVNNFPDSVLADGRRIPQNPLNKIASLKSRAKKHGIDLSFFDEFVDNHLRNSVFHSDYNIYGKEVRINKPQPRIYSHQEVLTLINRAQAYYEVFIKVFYGNIGYYDEPTLIDLPESFSHKKGEKGVVIVRKGYGVTGIKDNYTEEEIKRGAIPFRLCRYLPYEHELLEKGVVFLPENRVDRANKILNKLPVFIRTPLIKRIEKYIRG